MKRARTSWIAAIAVMGIIGVAAATAGPADAAAGHGADSPSYSVPCNSNARVYHNIRYSNGHWQGYIPPAQPPDSCITAITAAYAPDGAHFDVLGNAGLWDNVRESNGSWQGWERPVQPPGLIEHIAADNDYSGNIRYVVSTTDGIYTNVRLPSGHWVGWSEVSVPGSGPVTDVAIAVPSSDSFQIMVISGGELYHNVYNGGWQGWAQPAQPPGGPASIAGAGESVDLSQWLVTTLNGHVYHDIRYLNGTWQGWEEPPQPPGAGSNSIGNAAMTIDGNHDAQLTVAELDADGTTTLYHTIRSANGDWQAWASPGTPLFECGRLAVAAPYTAGVHDFQFATYCW
jgi:hypothetical protein